MRTFTFLASATAVLVVLLMVSCSKSNTSLPAKGLHAGVSDEAGIRYHDFDPDYFIEPDITSMNGVVYFIQPGKLNIDLDNDKAIDFFIQPIDPASLGGGSVIAGTSWGSLYGSDLTTDSGYVAIDTPAGPSPAQPTRRCFINTQRAGLSIATNVLSKNDVIDYHLNWEGVSEWFPHTTMLSSYTPASNGQEAIAFNNWEGNDHYVAVRDIKGKDTLYGWVGIQIENYDSVVVRDYGMMRRK
jgi:hypothetical protein